MMGSIRTDVVKSKNVSTLNLTAHLFTSKTLNNKKNNEVSYRAYLALFTPQRGRRAPTHGEFNLRSRLLGSSQICRTAL